MRRTADRRGLVGLLLWVVFSGGLPSGVGAQASGSEALGYVSHVEGTWLLAGDTVRLYRRLHVGDSLRVAPGSQTTPSLAAVLTTGQRVRFLCDLPDACAGPLVPADSVRRRSAILAFAGRVVRAVGFLMERDRPVVVSTISRGGPPVREAVIVLSDGTLDPRHALADASPGTYRLTFVSLTEDSDDRQPVLTDEVDWDPAGLAPLSAGELAPGLYRLDVARAGGLFPSPASAWVLVAESDTAGRLDRLFREALAITSEWPTEAESEARAFLRTYLRHLSEEVNGRGG